MGDWVRLCVGVACVWAADGFSDEGTVNLMIERSVVMCMGVGELVKRLESI